MKTSMKLLALLLLCAMLLSFVGCGGGTETPGGGASGDGGKMDPVEVLPGYDYTSVDLTQYVSFGDWQREDMAITINQVAEVTDQAIKDEFNGYFNQKGSEYYCAIADSGKAVANGDLVYMYYCGVTVSALEKAVREKKISDTHCTGLTYSEILALSLGFEGGTTNKMISLEIGSNTYIAGFESGLVGYVPAEAGEENPVRLELTFPSNYGNADLAGQDVIFFCKLVYIGNKSAGAYTADTISVELVNEIMGMSAEKAYKSLDECFARIREGMEQERDIALRNAKATAIFNEFLKRATIPTVPDEMLTAYIDSVLSSYLNQMVDMYNNNPMYYSYYFGTAKPSEKVVAAYLGYKTDDYREKMKADVTSAVKQEMIFWYYVQIEEITLSEQEIADMREKYIKLYGASVFEGLSDSVIKEQFIRDKFVDGQIAYMEEKNNITYKPVEVGNK
jgi:trigger factor